MTRLIVKNIELLWSFMSHKLTADAGVQVALTIFNKISPKGQKSSGLLTRKREENKEKT